LSTSYKDIVERHLDHHFEFCISHSSRYRIITTPQTLTDKKTMPPTRVGIIGLRAVVQDGYTPGTWGLQHLHSLVASPHYEVTAVCNTTTESAQKAIEVHNLSNARAYGSPEDIAADPNVDLVLVSVDVTKHVFLMEPALKHRKNILVEFPVAPTASEVRELADLAKENGVKVVVGSQARADPVFRKLQELVKTGEIGDVVSTTMVGHIPLVTADGWPHVQRDFLNVDSGISRSKGVLGHSMS
jgi:predicted dehydrogenase